jgi:copper chaperone CopZ
MKAIFSIEGMHCSNCAIVLESIEDELPGINIIIASYQKQNLIVRFEPDLIDIDDIINEINKKGYSIKSFQIEN